MRDDGQSLIRSGVGTGAKPPLFSSICLPIPARRASRRHRGIEAVDIAVVTVSVVTTVVKDSVAVAFTVNVS